MDFTLSQEQSDLRDAVVRFARRELGDDVARRDASGEFARSLWQRCAHFGVQGFPIPDQYGGSGLDPLSLAIALEALGYGCADNGLLFSLGAQMWSAEMPILAFGREEQKRRFLPGLCDGSLIGVQAMTEPTSGSDAFALATRAERTGSGYVLNGAKMFITNAPVADLFVVFARTGDEGFAGVSAFIVERGIRGVSVSREIHKMGLRTSPMGEVVFEDCEVRDADLLGPVGGGLAVFNSSMEWERGYILACAVGTMQRQLERCIRYARERRQFGQPIGKFQAVSHRIVDMHMRLETSRLLLYKSGWLRATGQNTSAASAMVKLHVSESFLASSLDAVQIHGGYGYTEEYELERDVRDAVGSRLYSGTSDIQRNIIAGRLGL
jgi:alkylation response protein AidB-like acyl-CoA dehydrogenase